MIAEMIIAETSTPVKPLTAQAVLTCPRQSAEETPAARWLRLYFYAQ